MAKRKFVIPVPIDVSRAAGVVKPADLKISVP
jgi:hypothetical protein